MFHAGFKPDQPSGLTQARGREEPGSPAVSDDLRGFGLSRPVLLLIHRVQQPQHTRGTKTSPASAPLYVEAMLYAVGVEQDGTGETVFPQVSRDRGRAWLLPSPCLG